MASTSNAENFMKIARIVYQLCEYTPTLELIFSKLEFAGSGWFSQIRSHMAKYRIAPMPLTNPRTSDRQPRFPKTGVYESAWISKKSGFVYCKWL